MDTTTIRIDVETHQRIRARAAEGGRPIMDVVRDAINALDRDEFGRKVRSQLDALRADPEAWAAYLAEGDALPVGDGID